MEIVLFIVGIVCGLVLGMGVTVVHYDDKKLEDILKGENNGKK